jgi:hypothetical protein
MSRPHAAIEHAIRKMAEAVIELASSTGIEPTEDLICLRDSGIEAAALRRLIKSGELPARKLGRKWFALRSDLAKLISSHTAGVSTRDPSLPHKADVFDLLTERTRMHAASPLKRGGSR